MGEPKVILEILPCNVNRVLTVQEFRDLINLWPYGHRNRLMFLLMGTCGLRKCEASAVHLDQLKLLDDENIRLTYEVWKQRKVMKDGILRVRKKFRQVMLPKFVALELRHFMRRNWQTFKDGYLWKFHRDTPDTVLARVRNKLGGSFKELLPIQSSGAVPNRHRISCHSLRRFYNSVHHLSESRYDPYMTARNIGHTDVKTNFQYFYSPFEVGLNKKQVSEIFGDQAAEVFAKLLQGVPKGQKTLEKWTINSV